jgi:hypothetical protein
LISAKKVSGHIFLNSNFKYFNKNSKKCMSDNLGLNSKVLWHKKL